MEENKIIEMETEEVIETKKNSKIVGGLRKIGTGIKKNWKPIVIGTVAFVAGTVIGSKKTGGTEMYSEEIVEPTEAEPISEETVE